MQKTILQVLPSLVSGGVETGTLDLANALVKQGYRSLVISSGGPLVKALEKQGTKHIQLPVHSKNPLVMWLNSRKLAKIIEAENIDLIHARSRAPAWSCLWASKATSTPFITTFHGVYGHQNKLKRWYNSAMLRSDHTIAVSKFVKNHIESTYPTFSDKVKLILRGIDIRAFNTEAVEQRAEQLKQDWQIPSNTKIIVLPGRLTRIKGHKVLIEALSKVSENYFCLFVGDEPGKDSYKHELEALIADSNLQDKIKFTGNYRDMPAVYMLADVVISASIKPESFGRVACEAQLMQKAVVATNHGGSQETIAPAFRDFMCEPNDASALSSAITRVLKLDQEEYRQRGIEAADYIRDNFTLEKMCRDTIALYELELSRN